MKLKRISLLLVSVLSVVLISCNNEEFSGNQDVNTTERLSVVLTSDLIHTKAMGDDQNAYSYSSSEELQINKVHIVFFRITEGGKPDVVIGMKEATFAGGQENDLTGDKKPAYRIEDITVLALKEKVYVLAIANSKYDFSACKRYADYLAVIEKNLDADEQPTALFSPTDLVKRGGIELDMRDFNKSEAIEIPLKQLAAKVVLKIEVDLPVLKETEGAATHSIDEFLSQIDKTNMQAAQGPSNAMTILDNSKNKMGIAYICKEGRSFSYNGQKCKDNVIVHVGDMTVDSMYTTVRPVLFIPSFKINNVETKSNILIPSTHTESTLLTLNGWKTNINVADHFAITFYTYQKELFDTDKANDVLNIELVNAAIVYKTEKIERTYTGASAHAVWTYIPGGGTDETKRIPTTGWGSPDETFKFVYLEDNIESATLQPIGEPTYTEVPNAGSVPLKNNIIRINPKRAVDSSGNQICTDGLMSGNLYEVTATIKNAEVGAKLEWSVVSFDKVEVTLPFD